MNILIYNWADLFTTSGGGVNVYVKNIIPGLLEHGYKVFYLNSGVKYTKDGKTRIEKQKEYIKGCEYYSIVNSPVLAPAHSMFNNLDVVIDNDVLYGIFKDFVIAHKIELIHFNNIEGLSLNILELKKELDIKIIYTIHNYNIVCPQVNLWKYEKENCIDNHNCEDCRNCVIPKDLNKERERRILTAQPMAKRAIRSFYRHNIRNKVRNILHTKEKQNKLKKEILVYKKYEQANLCRKYINIAIGNLNEYCDVILSVSKRTKNIVVDKGVRTEKHYVDYIGTKVASKFDVSNIKHTTQSDYLSICYMGYMRHDKGFWWFINALEQMPIFLKHRIKLTVAAKTNNQEEINRLLKLSESLAGFRYFNGYSQDDMDTILKDVDAGIVPVLWEDCLPQVAIEFVSSGIPIITSELGGAQELGNDINLVYRSKSEEEFYELLMSVLVRRMRLDEFWKTAMKPVTIEEHIAKLSKYYEAEY